MPSISMHLDNFILLLEELLDQEHVVACLLVANDDGVGESAWVLLLSWC